MLTALRALVMLSVLVGLPAAWVYYGPLPEPAQRVADELVAAAKDALRWNEAVLEPEREFALEPEASEAPAFATATAEAPPTAEAIEAAPSSESAAAGESVAQRLEPWLAKLREFGAAEYALERWGDGGQWYRFRCEMPLAASDELTQQFEAIAGDPQASVERVVAEVSSWRLAQQGAVAVR